MQTSVHLYPAHIKVCAVRRDLQKMLGEPQWTMACPRVPALLLLAVVGTLQAPLLVLNTSRAQEGEIVLAQCILQKLVPAARIVFCKDGMEVYSMKAHQDTVIYSMLLNISARSSGTYTCAYQQRNEEKSLEKSTLSAPLDLQVTDTNTPLNLTVIHVLSVTVTLLLSAATFWTIRKGACRERCRRQQHVPSQQVQATDYGEVQYSTIAHFQRDKPPVKQMTRSRDA
ncbi:uncharacterized protein LOC112531053 isoform X15 [Gallus gallus]|uniref:uncharacterized protein LOC112531053 isoform X15 n=1 Tax=Gallus gallus TaxID=9031 RepID=UPI001AE18E16|nr:uncharacterized protein LOC112531053 isoform X15 [Gallus gallus]